MLIQKAVEELIDPARVSALGLVARAGEEDEVAAGEPRELLPSPGLRDRVLVAVEDEDRRRDRRSKVARCVAV